MGITQLKLTMKLINTESIQVNKRESGVLMSKKQTDSFERLAKEYLSKCKCCDECFAESFCIDQQRRESRLPSKDKMKCVSNIYDYLHFIY